METSEDWGPPPLDPLPHACPVEGKGFIRGRQGEGKSREVALGKGDIRFPRPGWRGNQEKHPEGREIFDSPSPRNGLRRCSSRREAGQACGRG